MSKRYTLPEMGKLWSIENEWQTILDVELAACDAMAELGEIPVVAAANIRGKCADVLVPEFLLDVRPWSSGVIQSVKP